MWGELGEPRAIVLGDRDREAGIGAGRGLTSPQLPPLELEECPAPRPPLDRGQTLPDEIFDVVLEQHDRRNPVKRYVDRCEQKIRHTDICGTISEYGAHFVAELRQLPLPEIDRIRRPPRASDCDRKRCGSLFGGLIRN